MQCDYESVVSLKNACGGSDNKLELAQDTVPWLVDELALLALLLLDCYCTALE